MNIDITARHAQLTDRLRDHATERLAHALRYAEAVTSAHVIFDHERTRSIAEIVVRGRHLSAVVVADGDDPFLALDRCAEKLRHQLDHHVGRHKDRRRRAASVKAAAAELAALAAAGAVGLSSVPASAFAESASAFAEPATAFAEPATPVMSAEDEARQAAHEREHDDAAPDVVRTHVESLPMLSLEAACSSLHDSRLEFLVFREIGTSRVSVLYRRADGQVGLVETGAA